MSEQRLGSTFSVPQEMGIQQMERTQLGEDGAAITARKSLAEWILARKRVLAAVLLVGVAVTGCSQEVTGHADAMGGKAAPVVTTPKQTPTTPNAVGPFPCEKGGSLGVASTDPHVQNYTGLTDNDIAKLFATYPNDIEQCNGPNLTDTNPVVTSAEFEQISTGDRALVYVTDTITSTAPQLKGMSYVAYGLAEYPVVGNGSLFAIDYSNGDQNGYRIYQGGDVVIPDEKNPAGIRSYQGAIDRPVSANSNALYEVDAVILNNSATGDSLSPRITESAFKLQLGEWIDNKVVVLP